MTKDRSRPLFLDLYDGHQERFHCIHKSKAFSNHQSFKWTDSDLALRQFRVMFVSVRLDFLCLVIISCREQTNIVNFYVIKKKKRYSR